MESWFEEKEAATEMILGVCNLLPQELGHALPALWLPVEVPLNILEVCHDPCQTLCGTGYPRLTLAPTISPTHCQPWFSSDVPRRSDEVQCSLLLLLLLLLFVYVCLFV